jgi:hypothetical protein
MDKQPLEVQTLYAELLERLADHEARRAIGHVAGSFVTKTVKGGQYYYFQYLEPGGKKRQVYLGRKDEVLDRVVARHALARQDMAEDEESIQRLSAILRVGGIMTTDTPSARVVKALADAGVFRLGGVLIGTHAFIAIGNALGVRWTGASLRTQDVDVAAETSMSVVAPGDSLLTEDVDVAAEGTARVAAPGMTADIPAVLESLEMGFLPMPGLDPNSSSTSYKVRGKGLRVDLLTPARGRSSGPVSVHRLNAAARPMKFLDLVTEATIRAAVVDGGATSVNVPDPARFAFHKLIVAGERPPAMHSKSDKDLVQAAQLFGVLADERPGDLALAWESIASRGGGWERRVRHGIASMKRFAPDAARAALTVVGR